LKKLAALIDSKEILLFLPNQVKDEFTRNRSAKIADALSKLRNAQFKLSFPVFAKDYKEYGELRELMKKADETHAALLNKIMEEAVGQQLGADKVVSELFDKAKAIPCTDELYLKALKRVRLGNPPGKDGSMGDAVNWESLLSDVPNGEHIYVVSGDRDFRSQLIEREVNEFLEDEWWDRKQSYVHLYSKMSDFFKAKFPSIKLASEVERDLLIQKLAVSGSFATTHILIGRLMAYSEFAPAQVDQLVQIAKSNNQVHWIISDSDVHGFYLSLLEKYGKIIPEDAAVGLADIVQEGTRVPAEDETPLF
jgi:PIN domain